MIKLKKRFDTFLALGLFTVVIGGSLSFAGYVAKNTSQVKEGIKKVSLGK